MKLRVGPMILGAAVAIQASAIVPARAFEFEWSLPVTAINGDSNGDQEEAALP